MNAIEQALALVDELNGLTASYEKVEKAISTVTDGTIQVRTDDISYSLDQLGVQEENIKNAVLIILESKKKTVLSQLESKISAGKTEVVEEEKPVEVPLVKAAKIMQEDEKPVTNEEKKPQKRGVLDDKMEEIKKLYFDGASQQSIAEKYFVNPMTVCNFFKKHNLKKAKEEYLKKIADETITKMTYDDIYKMFVTMKMSVKDIAVKYKTDKDTVYKFMKENGIQRPR